MVLCCHLGQGKIYIYMNRNVFYNVLKPIFIKKHHFPHIICHNSHRGKINLCHNQFKVMYHGCAKYNILIYITVLKDPACKSLKLFSTEQKFRTYYELNNLTVKKYNEKGVEHMISVYTARKIFLDSD